MWRCKLSDLLMPKYSFYIPASVSYEGCGGVPSSVHKTEICILIDDHVMVVIYVYHDA